MANIHVTKKTTVQSYGEFYHTFIQMKSRTEPKMKGWRSLKLAALTMAAFSIESFSNHVGQHLFKSWEHIERGMSPMGKLRMFIEMLKIDIKYEEAPFNTVHELMKWRNQIAHGTTETYLSSEMATPDTYEQVLSKMEHAEWQKYVSKADIDRIDRDCTALMKLIHKKAFGNLHHFLVSSRHLGTAE